MLWKKIRPSVHCYNLFLRTVRDCGIGPPEVFQELLDSARPKKKLTDKQKITEKEMLRIEAQVHNNDDIAAAAKEAYHMGNFVFIVVRMGIFLMQWFVEKEIGRCFPLVIHFLRQVTSSKKEFAISSLVFDKNEFLHADDTLGTGRNF